MLATIFESLVFPLLAVAAIVLIMLVKQKNDELKKKTENELIKDALDQTSQLIIDCIKTTNQTYVNSLKEQGKFDKEAQKEAFNRTYQAVLAIVTKDTQDLLSTVIGDFSIYLTNEIESKIISMK